MLKSPKTPSVKYRLHRFLQGLAVAAVWLALWQLFYMAAKKTGVGLLVPSPLSVAKALAVLLGDKGFYLSCLKTLSSVLLSWGAGMLSGILLSVVTHCLPPLGRFFAPAVHAVKATPVASFIILAFVLMKAGTVPIFVGALMSLPIVWANMTEGLNAGDEKLTEMARAFGMSYKNRLLYLRLPAVKPYFTSAATSSLGLTWKAVVAAEVICIPADTIGEKLYNAKVYFETPSLFAWTAAVILLSVILEKLLRLLLKVGDNT